MVEDRIYIRFKGKTLGPLTAQKVQDLVRRGQITRMHELSSDGLAWVKAEEFGDFFRAARSPILATETLSATESPFDSVARASSQPRAGEPPVENVEWYAHIGGTNRGPLPTATMMQLIGSGEIGADTLVWRAGYDEWQPASTSFRDRFGGTSQAGSSQGANTWLGGGSDNTASGQVGVSSDAIYRMLRPRGWIMYLSISILIYCGLSVIYCITTMIVGAEQRFIRTGGASAVVAGLIGLTINGAMITGAVLLLQYALALRKLAANGDNATAILAARRLEIFWQYTAIAMIVAQVLFVGGLILLFTIGAAAIDAGG